MPQFPSSEAINWPSPSTQNAYESKIYLSGVTEPWIQQVITALMIARNAQCVVELGTYLGYTSDWLIRAMERNKGGRFFGIELELDRVNATYGRLIAQKLEYVSWRILHGSTIDKIPLLPDSIEFAWVDDCHEAPHVDQELALLRPKMAAGGIICLHDVSGPLGLDDVCRAHGGYVLHLPRLGPAGGLGIIQV